MLRNRKDFWPANDGGDPRRITPRALGLQGAAGHTAKLGIAAFGKYFIDLKRILFGAGDNFFLMIFVQIDEVVTVAGNTNQ